MKLDKLLKMSTKWKNLKSWNKYLSNDKSYYMLFRLNNNEIG